MPQSTELFYGIACIIALPCLHKHSGAWWWVGVVYRLAYKYACVLPAAQEIAVDDINSLESEFVALQHSVQK